MVSLTPSNSLLQSSKYRPITRFSVVISAESDPVTALLDISQVENITGTHIKHLTDLLDSDDPEQRRRTAEALGAIGAVDPELVDPAVDVLASLRLDPAVEVSEAARDALDQIDSV